MSDSQKTYACPVCGFHYRDEVTMKKCEAWCKEHGSCSSEITTLSVERSSPDVTPAPDRGPGQAPAGAQAAGCDDGVCRIPSKPADLEKKVEEATHQYLRALADYQNLQKEVAREREEMGAYAILRAVERFLPALDYFRAALAHRPDSDKLEAWFVGIGHIQKQFDDALRDLGIKKIATLGQKFDAAKHEAVGEESPGSDPERGQTPAPGTILREVQAGYEINGKVVRPARVIVVK